MSPAVVGSKYNYSIFHLLRFTSSPTYCFLYSHFPTLRLRVGIHPTLPSLSFSRYEATCKLYTDNRKIFHKLCRLRCIHESGESELRERGSESSSGNRRTCEHFLLSQPTQVWKISLLKVNNLHHDIVRGGIATMHGTGEQWMTSIWEPVGARAQTLPSYKLEIRYNLIYKGTCAHHLFTQCKESGSYSWVVESGSTAMQSMTDLITVTTRFVISSKQCVGQVYPQIVLSHVLTRQELYNTASSHRNKNYRKLPVYRPWLYLLWVTLPGLCNVNKKKTSCWMWGWP